MSKPNLNHPWRKGRSNQYATYLETLPLAERQRIEAAERAYVLRATLATSTQLSAARDHAKGMLGIKENVPWYVS